jgi:hypothetical protein
MMTKTLKTKTKLANEQSTRWMMQLPRGRAEGGETGSRHETNSYPAFSAAKLFVKKRHGLHAFPLSPSFQPGPFHFPSTLETEDH